MKIIGSTKGGFIAELSATEANKLSGTTPVIGGEYNPLDKINRADWINAESESLIKLEAQLRTATDRIGDLTRVSKGDGR